MDAEGMSTETEAPALQFDDYDLGFHFAVEWKADQVPIAFQGRARRTTDEGAGVEPMESYERDMLLYAHRDEPPFRTHVVSAPDALTTLTARFPPELVYESEQRRIRLELDGAGETGRSRRFRVLTSETIFERSRIAVLNVVLRPLGDEGDESQLNEYDVIKLIKLWEGGEGRRIPEWEKEILFATEDGEKTLELIAHELFPEWLPQLDAQNDRASKWRRRLRGKRHDPVPSAAPFAYRVGTVELRVPPTDWCDELFREIAELKEGGAAPDRTEEPVRWGRVVAVGGVLQGLLDFRCITSDELADVFAEVDIVPDDQSLVGFHKGTLLSLSAEVEPDPDERDSPIGVDPYLAIPNVVLLHNEQRLKAARQLELHLSGGQPGPWVSGSDRVDIDETANGLDEMTGLLAQHLPNVFHYPAERRLFETGEHSRGFDDLETLVRRRREELMSTLQRRERRRDKWTAIFVFVTAVVVGLVAAVQTRVVDTVTARLEWWIILIAAGVLYLAYARIRNRLF